MSKAFADAVPPLRGRDLKIVLLLTLLAAIFRFPGLGYPPEEYFDEVYHAKAAWQYLQGESPVEWVHPPTAKLLIAIGVRAFGYQPWAWRLAPAVAGTLIAPVFFLLARGILPTERAALLASTLLLSDGVYLVQSRIAMTNVFAVLFQLASVLVGTRLARRERLSFAGMTCLGLVLGLALSTRWTSLWAWGFLGLIFLALRRRRLLRARELALVAFSFALLPAAVYLLSYVPWMLQGHTVREVVTKQVEIWHYHATLQAKHPYFSPWWTWPWLYRPTWYFYKGEPCFVRGIIALGNPLLWWVSVPVSIWALVRGFRRREAALVFAGAGFFLMYLPWGISPRTLNYSHYLFEAIPYACLALGFLLDREWDGPRQSLTRGYWVTVVGFFVLFLPLLIGTPLPSVWWSYRFPWGPGIWTWFRSWI